MGDGTVGWSIDASGRGASLSYYKKGLYVVVHGVYQLDLNSAVSERKKETDSVFRHRTS